MDERQAAQICSGREASDVPGDPSAERDNCIRALDSILYKAPIQRLNRSQRLESLAIPNQSLVDAKSRARERLCGTIPAKMMNRWISDKDNLFRFGSQGLTGEFPRLIERARPDEDRVAALTKFDAHFLHIALR